MDNDDIDRFLKQLSPAQETVALLKQISSQLNTLMVMLSPEGIDTLRMDPADLIKDIAPTKTPFFETISRKGKQK